MTWLTRATILRDEIQANPMLRDYLRRHWSDSGPLQPMSSPEDVLGERAAMAMDLVVQALRGDGPAFSYSATEYKRLGQKGALSRESLALTAEHIYRADPYLWTSDVRRMAAAQDVPRHVFTPDSVPQSMWWTWDVDLMLGDRLPAVGALWINHGNGVEVMQIARSEDPAIGMGVITYQVIHLPAGLRFPDDVPDGYRDNYRADLALLSFLNSPYIPKVETRIDRRLRSTYEREGASRESVDQLVRFIDLRSPEGGEETDSGPGHGDYRHRWLVRGHHRAQWYPSLQAHKVIWVSPYVKGPDGAPMITPAYRVRR